MQDGTNNHGFWTTSGTLNYGWSSGTITTAVTSLMTVSSSGTLTAAVLNATSDRNVKTNIRNIENALSIVEGVNGVRFDWKKNNLPSAGLIAQEVEAFMPELVDTNDEGVKSMNYAGMVGVLVEAVKEMSSMIKDLQKEIRLLKGE